MKIEVAQTVNVPEVGDIFALSRTDGSEEVYFIASTEAVAKLVNMKTGDVEYGSHLSEGIQKLLNKVIKNESKNTSKVSSTYFVKNKDISIGSVVAFGYGAVTDKNTKRGIVND